VLDAEPFPEARKPSIKLGAMPTATEVVLLAIDQPVANGTRIG
jgi:hypothetical protein